MTNDYNANPFSFSKYELSNPSNQLATFLNENTIASIRGVFFGLGCFRAALVFVLILCSFFSHAQLAVEDISLTTSGTGNSGEFIITNMVTAQWVDPNGDDAASVDINFSEFGGGSVAASNASGTWTASFSIVAGVIETTTADVTVTVTGGSSTGSLTDDEDHAVDANPPSATGITSSITPILTDSDIPGQLTFTISFDEPMDTGGTADPSISFPLGGVTGLAINLGSSGWNGNDYEAVYDITDTDLERDDIHVKVSGAKDAAGNFLASDYEENDLFSIDTKNPSITGVTTNHSLISDSETGGTNFYIEVAFDEVMIDNGTQNPSITFDNINPTTTLNTPMESWEDNQTFRVTYTVADGGVDISTGLDVLIAGGQDVAGNTITATLTDQDDLFTIDTENPTIANSVTFSPSNVILGVDDDLIITVTAGGSETGLSVNTALVNGENVSTSFSPQGGGVYEFTYTVGTSDTDRAAGTIPVSFILEDAAGNTSGNETTVAANTTGVDATEPSITGVTTNIPQITDAQVGGTNFYIEVAFDEPMIDDGSENPMITFDNVNPTTTLNTPVETWPNSQTFRVTYTVADGDVDVSTGLDVLLSGGKDEAGNDISTTNTDNDNLFTIETENPSITGVTTNHSLISDSETGGMNFYIEVAFDEAMIDNGTQNPSITFDNINPTTTLNTPMESWEDNQTFRVTYTVADGGVDISTGLDVLIAGGQDVAGNTITATLTDQDDLFTIDTENPTIANSVTFSPSNVILGVDDDLIITVTAGGSETGLSVNTALVNGENVSTSFSPQGGGVYEFTYTVGTSDTDRAAGTIPVSFILEDAAGNTSGNETTVAANTTGVDATEPSITGVTTNIPQITDAQVGGTNFYIEVAFDKPMIDDGSENPMITFDNVNPTTTLNTPVETWPNSQTFRVTYTVADGDVDVSTGLDVLLSGGKDEAGNDISTTNTDNDNLFTIETENPSITGVTTNHSLISDSETGGMNFYIEVAFDEAMIDNGTQNPSITFDNINPTTTLNTPMESWEDNQTFRVTYTVADGGVDISTGLDVLIAGGQDVAGNTITATLTDQDDLFTIDTENPTISSVSIPDGNAHIRIVFSEPVANSDGNSAVDETDFAISNFTNNGSAGATAVGITTPDGVTDDAGAALTTGGWSILEVLLDITGTPDTDDQFQIGPSSGSALYDLNGNAMNFPGLSPVATLDEVNVSDIPVFEWVYPNTDNSILYIKFSVPVDGASSTSTSDNLVFDDNGSSDDIGVVNFTDNDGSITMVLDINDQTMNRVSGGDYSIWELDVHDITGGTPKGIETYRVQTYNNKVYNRLTGDEHAAGGRTIDPGAMPPSNFLADELADDFSDAVATAYDTDGDGNIDEVEIVMPDGVDDSTIEPGDFRLDDGGQDADGQTFDTGSTNDDNTFTIGFTTYTGTSVTNLDYTASRSGSKSMLDDAEFFTYEGIILGHNGTRGNAIVDGTLTLGSGSAGDIVDAAGPVAISATTGDTEATPDGKVDELVVTFSEPITGTGSLMNSSFTMDGGSYGMYTASANGVSGSDVTLTLNEIAGAGVYDTDLVITLDVAAGIVQDAAAAANPVQDFANSNQVTSTDGAAPYVTVTQIASTSDATPDLGGVVDDPTASVLVSVGSDVVLATNNMDGTWTLLGTSITPLNPGGPYQVVLSAFDLYANIGTDAQTNDILSVTGGVVISEPSAEIICIGEEVVLDNITLTETNSTDFSSSGTFILSLPAGFEYNTGAVVTVSDNSGDVDVDAGPVQYNGTTNFSIQLANDNSDDDLDVITIIGLTVKAVGAVAQNSEVISIGGTAGYSTGQSQIGELSSLEVADAIIDVDVDGQTVTEYAASYTGTLVVNYNNTHGPTFTDGEDFTFSGGSTAEMVPGTDNGSSFTVFLTSGTTIGVNESFTGGLSANTSTVSVATTAGTPYLEPFDITVDDGGNDAEWYDDAGSPITIASGGATTTNVELGATSPGLYSYDITINNGTCENQPFRFNILIYDDTDGDGVDTFYDRNFISDNPAVTLNLSHPTDHTILIYGDGITVTNPTTDPIVVTFDPSLAFDPNVQTTVNEITYSVTNDNTGEQFTETVNFTVDKPTQIFTFGELPLDICYDDFPYELTLSQAGLSPGQEINYIYFRNTTFGGANEYWYRFANEFGTYPTGPYTFGLNPRPDNPDAFTSWLNFSGTSVEVADGDAVALYVERGLNNPNAFSQENIFVYGDPIVEITNLSDVYCGDDAPVTIQRKATYATGFDSNFDSPSATYKPIIESETKDISTGYILLKADPTITPASGGPYSTSHTAQTSVVVNLTDGEYEFNLFDSFGDGILAPGTFTITDAAASTVFSLAGNPSYTSLTETFCIGTDPWCFQSPLTINVTTDQYPSEITWEIVAGATYSFYADFTSSMTSTFNPSDPDQDGDDYTVEDESGDYRIVYTSEGLTPTGTCTGSTFVDVTINSIPEIGKLLSPLEVGNAFPFQNYSSYSDLIGDVWLETVDNSTDYNGNDSYFVEYYGVSAVTNTGYLLTNESQSSYNWYREDLSSIIQNGNWFLYYTTAYDNPNTPVLDAPQAGQTYDFYFARVADGCEGELRKLTAYIYNETASPQMDATWVSSLDPLVSSAVEAETNHYQIEYCDTYIPIELEDPDASGSVPTSRNPSAYYKIYAANPDGSKGALLDDYHPTGTLSVSDLGVTPGTSTITVYVSQVWNDQTPGSAATDLLPYEGGEGPATRLDITVYDSPSAPTLLGDFPTLSSLDIQICEGEVFTSFVNTAADIDEYIWYAPDMSTEIKRVAGGSTLNAIDLQPTIYYDKDVPAEYEFYVSRISNRNNDTGFTGCESDLTRVTISVHPIADEAIVSSVDYLDEESDPVDVTYSVCILDYSVDDVLSASSTYSSAPFAGDEKEFLWYSATSSGVSQNLTYTGDAPDFGDLGMSNVTAATTFYYNVVQRTDNSYFDDMVGCDSPPAFVTVNFKVAEDFYFKSEVVPSTTYNLYNSGAQFCHDESYFDITPSLSTSTSDADFIESNSYTYTLYEGGTNTIVEVASMSITGSGPLTMSLDAFHYASGGTDTGGASTDFDLAIDYFDPIAECTRSKVFSFTINPQPVATFLIEENDYENDVLFPDPIEVCYDDGVLDLEGVVPITFDPLSNLSGNLFASPSGAIGNLGNNKANFNIISAHPNPFSPEAAYDVSFTYTDLKGCDVTLNKTIIVKPRPKPSGSKDVNQIQFNQICKESDALSDAENEISAFIQMLDPSDGVSIISDYSDYVFTWSVNGSLVGSLSNTNSITFEESANNLNFSVVVTNPEGCQVTVTETHTKQDMPNLNIDGIVNNQPFCTSDADKTLTLKDGVVDAATSTISWTVVSYNTDSGMASATETFSGSGSNPTINIHDWHEAAGGNLENLDGDIVGGPSTIHTITMIYQDNTRDYQGIPTQCTNIVERTIQINPLPDISFDVEFLNELEGGYTETFCYDYGLISLQGIFADGSDLTGGSGSFSGPGVIPTGNSLATWNPVSAHGSDAHKVQTGYDITFTYTDPNGCQYAVTKTLNVNPLPNPIEFGPGNDQIQFSQICAESPIVAFVELDGVSDYSNFTFDWDLPGDATGNSSTVDNSVTYESAITNNAADHNFDIGVVITNTVTGCQFTIEEDHDQQELPELDFSEIFDGEEFCQQEETRQLALFTNDGEIGVGARTDISNLSYSVTSAFNGNTNTNSFSGPGNPEIDFAQWHADAGGAVTGGSATTHTITMTYQDLTDNEYQGEFTNCTNSVSATITIYPNPDLSFKVNSVDIFDASFEGSAGDSSPDEFCYDDDLVDLDGAFGALTEGLGFNIDFGSGQFTSPSTPGAIILTGSNNNALFDPEFAHGSDPHAPRSAHTIRFTYTDENLCQNYVEKDIYVNPLPDPVEVTGGTPEDGDQIKFSQICEGSPITAYVELVGVSDYSDYTYAWDLPNDATDIMDANGDPVVLDRGIASVAGFATANVITYTSSTVDFSIDVTITRGTTGCSFVISEDHEQQPLPDLNFTEIIEGEEFCQEEDDLELALSTNTGFITGADLANLSYSVVGSSTASSATFTDSGTGNPVIDFMTWHLGAGGSEVGGEHTSHTITMTYQDLSFDNYQGNFNNCTSTAEMTIKIYPRPTLSYTYEQQGAVVDEEVCIDESRLTLRSSLAEESGITEATFSVSAFTPSPVALEDNNDGTADINIERLFLDAIGAGVLDDSGATATRSSRSITIDIDLFYETEFLCTNVITQSVTIHNLPVPEYDITQNGSSLVVGGVVEVCIDDISDAEAAISDRILLADITNQVTQGSRTAASFVENNYSLGSAALENVGTNGQAYFYPQAAVQVAEAANPTLVSATSIDFIFDMSYTNEFGCTGSTLASDAVAGVVDHDNRLVIRVYRTPQPTIKVDVAGFSRDESDYCIDHEIDTDPIRLFVEDITFDTGAGSGGTFVSDPPLSAAALYGAIVNGSGLDEIYFNPEVAYAEHPTANTDNGDVATFEITYIYSTSDKACANVPSNSTIKITVNPKPFVEFIVDQGVGDANNEFCIDAEVLRIRGFAFTELSQTTDISDLGQGDFATNITGSPGVTKNVNNIYDVNFTNAYNANGGTRTHTVTYTYVNNETGCYNSATQDIIINTKPVVAIDVEGGCDKLPVDFAFLTVETAPNDDIASVYWDFKDNFAESDGTLKESVEFFPTKTYGNAGEYFPTLKATSDKGCTSVEVSKNVQIGDIPDVNFTVEGICDDSEFTFVASPTSVSFGTVKSIAFNYDDGTPVDSLDTGGNPDNFILKHTYTDPGVYDVQLILTTNNDCVEIHERKVAVQPNSMAPYFEDFDTAMPNTRTFVEWEIKEEIRAKKEDDNENIITEDGVIIEAAGWSVDFRPLDDKEETDAGYWGKLPSDFNTWQFGVPSGVLINNDEVNHGNVWATNLDGDFINNENLSWVYSPCFDFSALKRPMVSFDQIYHFPDSRDGVVLEYSTDGGLVWNVLGFYRAEDDDATGTNWYTHQDIFGQPGAQVANFVGWSDNLNEQGVNVARWGSSRHKLDEIPVDDRGSVIFRFALGSDASTVSEGFAFDNFRIDEREKNVLLEQFSNTNTDDSRTVNEDIDNILRDPDQNNDDIISINYHTSFAGELDIYDGSTNPPVLTNPDPISIVNIEDPSARSAYYGIADAPASVLDGQFELGDPEASETIIPWTRNDIARSSLEDALFDIVISDNFGSDPFVLEVDVTATAQADIGDGTARELALYIAIIEKDVEMVGASNAERTSFNALRKMLPSGIGFREEKEFLTGVSIETTQSWDITNNVDATDLAIVVFVQDVESKTVYQTVTKDVVGKESPTVTGIDDTLGGEDYSLYPNPANQEVFVVFEKTTIEVMHWSIYDQTGKVYKLGKLKPGAEGFSLETRHFPAGMYFISLNGENLKFRNKKLMITH